MLNILIIFFCVLSFFIILNSKALFVFCDFYANKITVCTIRLNMHEYYKLDFLVRWLACVLETAMGAQTSE